MQRNFNRGLIMQNRNSINRDFYDLLWSGSRLTRPDRFNTWPLISGLLPLALGRLEIGPGLRPRLPISGTCFVDISPPVIERLKALGGNAVPGEITDLPFSDGKFELVCAFEDPDLVDLESFVHLRDKGHVLELAQFLAE